jgi:HSP20 family protein
MERLRREMNRLMAGATPEASGGYPAMNVWANEDGAIVTAELPGVDVEALDISVVENALTVSGARELDLPEDATFHRRERGYGKFARSFQLPFRVDAGAVEATFDKGVLSITLPRTEEDKPRKITIKAE